MCYIGMRCRLNQTASGAKQEAPRHKGGEMSRECHGWLSWVLLEAGGPRIHTHYTFGTIRVGKRIWGSSCARFGDAVGR